MDYTIVIKSTAEELECSVKKLMLSGWMPSGSPQFNFLGKQMWYQAMINESEDVKEEKEEQPAKEEIKKEEIKKEERLEKKKLSAIFNDEEFMKKVTEIKRIYGRNVYVSKLKNKAKELGLELNDEDIP